MKKRERRRVQFACSGPSRAIQSAKDECDVNGIMRRFERTGLIDHVNRHSGGYGDFTNAPQDYQSAVNQVLAAQDMFGRLPAGVRRQFRNDPGELLALVAEAEAGDQVATDELVRLGLARARPAPTSGNQVEDQVASGSGVKVGEAAAGGGPKAP